MVVRIAELLRGSSRSPGESRIFLMDSSVASDKSAMVCMISAFPCGRMWQMVIDALPRTFECSADLGVLLEHSGREPTWLLLRRCC